MNHKHPKCFGYTYLLPPTWSSSTKTKFKTRKFIKNQKLITNIKRIKNNVFILYLFRYLALKIIAITMVQCLEFPSSKNISDCFNINDHIANALQLTFKMNYSSVQPVLFEKLPVADPGVDLEAMAPCPQFFTFHIWKYVPNKTLGPLAPEIGPWLKFSSLASLSQSWIPLLTTQY